MQPYELIYILSGDIADEEIEAKTKQVKKGIEAYAGKIAEENLLGRRSLNFPIKKQVSGIYVQLFFDLEPAKVQKLKNELNTYPFVIRYLFSGVTTTKPSITLKAKPKPEVAEVKEPAVIEEKEPKEKPIKKVTAKKAKAEKVKAVSEKPVAKKPKEHEITREIESEGKRLKKLDEKIEELLKE